MASIGVCQAVIDGAMCGEQVGEKTKFCRACATPERRKANDAAQKALVAERNQKAAV